MYKKKKGLHRVHYVCSPFRDHLYSFWERCQVFKEMLASSENISIYLFGRLFSAIHVLIESIRPTIYSYKIAYNKTPFNSPIVLHHLEVFRGHVSCCH